MTPAEEVVNLGVAAGIAVYLVYWVTSKLNSKLDRLAEAMERLADRIEEVCGGGGG